MIPYENVLHCGSSEKMATAFLICLVPYEDVYSLVSTGVTPHPLDSSSLGPEKDQFSLPQTSFSNGVINSRLFLAHEITQI